MEGREVPAPVADAPVELMDLRSSQGVRDTIDGLSDSHNETLGDKATTYCQRLGHHYRITGNAARNWSPCNVP